MEVLFTDLHQNPHSKRLKQYRIKLLEYGVVRSKHLPLPLQLEVGEAPSFLRRYKIRMNYWVNLKGHKESHPIKGVIEECWEHGNRNIKSLDGLLKGKHK